MNYLERNRLLIQEIRDSTQLVLGEAIGGSYNISFHSLGSYPSRLLGRELFLGIKMPQIKVDLKDRFSTELPVIERLANSSEERYAQLPALYGILEHVDQGTVGIITEDFSKGGTVKIKDDYDIRFMSEKPKLAQELRMLFPGTRIYERLIGNMGLLADGEFRLMDFDNILSLGEIIQWDQIEEAVRPHTLVIDYPIE